MTVWSGDFYANGLASVTQMPKPGVMVKDQPWPEGGKALVAVNLAVKSRIIMRSMKNWSKRRSNCGTSQPYRSSSGWRLSGNANNIAIELPEFDPSVYNDAIRGNICWQ